MTNGDGRNGEEGVWGPLFLCQEHEKGSLPATNLGGPTGPGFPVLTADQFRNFSVAHTYLFNPHL